MIFNKNYQVFDYRGLDKQYKILRDALSELQAYHLDAPEREWEYCMALHALDCMTPAKIIPKVLDVGSGKSPFPYILHKAGFHVECFELIDRPKAHETWPWQPAWHCGDAPFHVLSFDFVTSISMIEHCEHDLDMLTRMWELAAIGMFVTFDSTEDGRIIDPRVHKRTYTMQHIVELVSQLPGAAVLGDVDYTYHGDNITVGSNSCSFGSICVKRV